MSRFNLLDEKWIPVRFPDGTRDELGIRDILLRAKEIAAIEDPSPLVVAALHRFLLAVLYRALEGPTDIDQAKALFQNGLPADKITTYLDKWRDRFWLFDEKYPFGQVPSFKPKTWRAWTVLAAEHNADNAKVLFDHVDVSVPGVVSAAACSRWLLATQTFSVSCGKSELSHTGTAPSAGSVMAIPIGLNLLDTLLFCLVPQNREVMREDIALWEKEPESLKYLKTTIKVPDKKSKKKKDRAVERSSTGIVDIFTWRTRSILLKLKESPFEGVYELGFASGIGHKDSLVLDPMLGYAIVERKDGEAKEKVKKRVSIHFQDRGFWRDFDSLLPDDSRLAPKVIENAVSLARIDRKRFPMGVMILGQRYAPPRPNIIYWRKEFFVLPEALAGDKFIRSDIRRFLDAAEDAQRLLWSACFSFARDLLIRGERNSDTRDSKGVKKDVKKIVSQMPSIPWYWSTLEAKFHEILQDYTLEKNPDEVELKWMSAVRVALDDAWRQQQASVSMGDAWAIRALVKAERLVSDKLKELDKVIANFKKSLSKEDV